MAQHYIPPQRPGRALLYMPELIISGFGNSLADDQSPLSPQEWHSFPFLRLLGPRFQPERFACKRLEEAAVRTIGGTTATAAQVNNLPIQQQLRFIRRCRPLWDNLTTYCYPSGPGVPTVAPPTVPENEVPPPTHTYSLPESLPLPDARQQASVLDTLFGWYIGHNGRRPAAMTSEPSIQDEVLAQIIDPLNLLLQTRYINRNPVGNGPFYPQWGRSCPRAHRTPRNRSNAGFPDFILYFSPRLHDHASIMEVKTWWSYEDRDLMDIFSATTASSNSALFIRGRLTPTCVLLKQLWGELYSFQVKWGACTNGRKIFIFVKASENELTLSEIHDFDDLKVHEALLGMCFASIDEAMGARFVLDFLCPPRYRESNW